MKHRITGLLLALLLLLTPCAAWAESESLLELTAPDTFLAEHAEDAVLPEESNPFDAYYRVVDLNPISDRGERF